MLHCTAANIAANIVVPEDYIKRGSAGKHLDGGKHFSQGVNSVTSLVFGKVINP